jgi:hypothetical protein
VVVISMHAGVEHYPRSGAFFHMCLAGEVQDGTTDDTVCSLIYGRPRRRDGRWDGGDDAVAC